MQIRTFTLPIHDDGGWADELNRFLGSHRVLEVEREFVLDGPRRLRRAAGWRWF